jgi:hypothetical protein
MIRSSLSTILLKVGSKAPVKKLREPESKPEPKERTVTVLKLTVWIGLIEGGIRAFEDIYWNEQ